MAFDGSDDPAWCPAIPMQRQKEWRLRIAQFGDGYQQRALDGINALNRKWNATYEMKPVAVIEAMEDYLEAAKGDSFPFRDPATGEIFKVTCEQWQTDWMLRQEDGALYGTLSAEFTKFNGINIP